MPHNGYEIYVLGSERTLDAVERFLTRFMPHHTECWDEYSVPELVDNPEICFDNAREVIEYLEHRPDMSYGLYWANTDPTPPYQAMIFFTRDGNMILGLADSREDRQATLEDLAKGVGASFGYLTLEERPPDTTEEFVQACLKSRRNGIESLIGP